MANAYATLIKAKRRTIDTILPEYKEEALATLKGWGYDGYGDKLPEEMS